MSLLSVDEARERILSHFHPVTTETLPLVNCANRVLAQDIAATTELPLFDNSSMDGFAIRVADVLDATAASPRSLRVVADIPAGLSPTISLAPGEAARIMTGAQIPNGADAVIPVEDTDFIANLRPRSEKSSRRWECVDEGSAVRLAGRAPA